MFFAGIISFLIFLGFAYIVWHFIILPILIDRGIVDPDKKEVKNKYTKELDRLKEELKEKEASRDAAEDIRDIQSQIERLEERIADTEVNL